jgi:hypothetical protein
MPTKVSILIELELATELPDEQLVTEVQDHVRGGIRPDWKGFHFPKNLPGAFAGKPKRVDVAIGHDVYQPTTPRRRKKK